MRLLFVAYMHGFGGAERQLIMLANAMVDRGHDVAVVSLHANNVCYELNKKIKYIFLPDKGNGMINILFRYWDLKKVVRDMRPDVSINFWLQSAYLMGLMSRRLTGKIIYSERGDPGDKEYNGLLGVVRTIIFHRISGFVFQSKGAKDYFGSRVQKRSVIIQNPTFLKREDYPEVSERKKVIVSVGRLHEQKNFTLLIDAFSMIASKYPEYCLEIFGDGELKESLKNYISACSLADRVKLMGTYKNVHQKIYDAALFVLSSDYEGLPNALIEAMTLGIPCISTDCRPGGAREIIKQGENGIIVPCGDVEALSLAIDRLLSMPKMAKCMADNAAKDILRFSPQKIYDQWENFLTEL